MSSILNSSSIHDYNNKEQNVNFLDFSLISSGEYEWLNAAFTNFSSQISLLGVSYLELKERIQSLKNDWQNRGVSGEAALAFIAKHQHVIDWEGMTMEHFYRFYRFAFHVCRETNKRNLQCEVAVPLWRLILRGRFRLLDRWCLFMERQNECVTEDTWRQVYDFSRLIHEDLGNYDATSSWPVALDEFVEQLRSPGQRSGTRLLDAACNEGENVRLGSTSQSGPATPLMACGAKRRPASHESFSPPPMAGGLAPATASSPPAIDDNADTEPVNVETMCTTFKRHCRTNYAVRTASQVSPFAVPSRALPLHLRPGQAVLSLSRGRLSSDEHRMTGVSNLVHASVADALGLSASSGPEP